MPVQETNDPDLLTYIGSNEHVILKYHSDLGGDECKEIIEMFNQLSNEKEYKNIIFLSINSQNNPTAKKYLEGKKTCIVSIYHKGRLLESRYAEKRHQVKALLKRLIGEN